MRNASPSSRSGPGASTSLRFLGITAAGLALGGLSVLLAALFPWWIWFLVTDTSAVWCAAVIALGALAATRPPSWRLPAAGAVVLLCAVVGYYAVTVLVSGGAAALPRPAAWLFPAWLWLLAACVAGPVLTVAGAWTRHGERTRRLAGLGLLGGVFLAEGLLPVLAWTGSRLRDPEVPPPPSPAPMFTEAALLALLGAALVLLVARRPGDRPRALAAMPPAGLVWCVGVWGADRVMLMTGTGYFG
ncbi:MULTISPECIES: DUF6518 family protein [unclassified Nocardiopsis]|uniref:DUF6518 family protein n=1 Tax=unclassified Nocardiopsis TaxID=2649073 RepID=UPI00135ABFA6|nr:MULTISPECIES: DUF6518 family protein [unclassified Nocardiopsis]